MRLLRFGSLLRDASGNVTRCWSLCQQKNRLAGWLAARRLFGGGKTHLVRVGGGDSHVSDEISGEMVGFGRATRVKRIAQGLPGSLLPFLRIPLGLLDGGFKHGVVDKHVVETF